MTRATIAWMVLLLACLFVPNRLAGAEAKKPRYAETDRIDVVLEPGQQLPPSLKQHDLFARLKVILKPDGSAGTITVEESSGDPRLDATAIERFKNAKFGRRDYDILYIPLTFTSKQPDARGELDTEPYKGGAEYAPGPDYPPFAKSKHLEGSGMYRMHVLADGTVGSVDVVKSSGHGVLDEAAISALKRWRFPKGKPKIVKSPVIFSLKHVR